MKKLLLVAFVILANSVFAQNFMAQTDPPMLGKVCPEFSMSVIMPNKTEKNLPLMNFVEKL